jgi:hypothetical protein
VEGGATSELAGGRGLCVSGAGAAAGGGWVTTGAGSTTGRAFAAGRDSTAAGGVEALGAGRLGVVAPSAGRDTAGAGRSAGDAGVGSIERGGVTGGLSDTSGAVVSALVAAGAPSVPSEAEGLVVVGDSGSEALVARASGSVVSSGAAVVARPPRCVSQYPAAAPRTARSAIAVAISGALARRGGGGMAGRANSGTEPSGIVGMSGTSSRAGPRPGGDITGVEPLS